MLFPNAEKHHSLKFKAKSSSISLDYIVEIFAVYSIFYTPPKQ
ncbi:hypothetical protein JCM19240_3105 [Vibrio maritimus]|uniref:Uncharacterized protein n=1 Tax=Vibrio maritimus TaxID=990268 RepID=A0A090TE16_9VIBR|nr:hypothetical protein JCM19240_3105 [Vibrio maritimus]